MAKERISIVSRLRKPLSQGCSGKQRSVVVTKASVYWWPFHVLLWPPLPTASMGPKLPLFSLSALRGPRGAE